MPDNVKKTLQVGAAVGLLALGIYLVATILPRSGGSAWGLSPVPGCTNCYQFLNNGVTNLVNQCGHLKFTGVTWTGVTGMTSIYPTAGDADTVSGAMTHTSQTLTTQYISANDATANSHDSSSIAKLAQGCATLITYAAIS